MPHLPARLACFTLALFASVAWAAAPATPADAAAAHWRGLAETDAAAALALIAEHHPGAAPELGDKAFQALLATARQHVKERLPQATSYEAYSALMAGLAADFRDGHIWSRAQLAPGMRTWAGLMPVRRGGKWVVGVQEAAPGEPALQDAEILSCDGRPFDAWARERIGLFGGNAAVEAVLAQRAPALLLDDGNPYLARPDACRFRMASGQADAKAKAKADAEQDLRLQWRRLPNARLQELGQRALKPVRAGMGVEAFEGGYWIRLESLDPSAKAVVSAVQEQADALRAAAMVVIDLRGNGGGNSEFAREIARVLAGPQREAATRVALVECSGAYWRATAGNADGLEAVAARFSGEQAAGMRKMAADLRAAVAAGQRFAPALPPCAANVQAPDQSARPDQLPPAAMRGRLVLVTDRACFSSCLIATNLFRRLGALHVGEATDVSTRYMEVREIILPSGLRSFSTLQKVAVGLQDYGPYEPDRPYPGALDDTQALMAWVARLR